MIPFRVQVPASSANLGSGFDTVGLSLSLYNFFDVLDVLPSGRYELEVHGEGGKALETETNSVVTSYEAAFRHWGEPAPGLRLRMLNVIPLKRGLGSSSSAIVGGVVIANALRRTPRPKEELLPLVVSMEGHPDNVVPCCLGGMVVSCWNGEELRFVRMPPLPSGMMAVVAVPAVELSTTEARRALPQQVPLQDAVYNLSRSALLAASWAMGNWDNLPWAMDDRLHQPFRARLFPGGEAILEEVRKIPQCAGVAISGSGPSMLAFTSHDAHVVAELMCSIFSRYNVRSRFFVLSESAEGAKIVKLGEDRRDSLLLGKGSGIPMGYGQDPSGHCVVERVISDPDVAKIAVLGVPDVPGIAARLFSSLAARDVGAEMIVQSVMRGETNDIAFIIKKSRLEEAISICTEFSSVVQSQGVTFDTDVAKVGLMGEHLAGCPSIPSQMFTVLASKEINIDMIAAASTVMACIVASRDMDKAASALSEVFLGCVR